MEAFTLLKFRRGSSGAGTRFFTGNLTSNPRTTTISSSATALKPPSSDTDDAADDGPYFDLEFALPDEEEEEEEEEEDEEEEEEEEAKIQETEVQYEESEDENDDQEGELKFELSKDQNVILSPSDDLFFKGQLLPIEPSNILLNSSENNSKFPAALVKSATKFRVLLLKLKKSKSEKNEANGHPKTHENGKENQTKIQGNKFFFVKFKVEEAPLVSLFTRDSSSKGNNNGGGQKNEVEDKDSSEKKLTKETVQKYLKKVKPLYIRVSKRYGEKLKIAGHLSSPGGETKSAAAPTPPCAAAEKLGEGAALSNVKSQKQGNNLQAGLKVVLKHWGKNRPESSSAPLPEPATDPPANTSSSRRDDSLLQQHDGIQGAILHCKRSFNASREMESFVLPRSASDPSHEKSSQ